MSADRTSRRGEQNVAIAFEECESSWAWASVPLISSRSFLRTAARCCGGVEALHSDSDAAATMQKVRDPLMMALGKLVRIGVLPPAVRPRATRGRVVVASGSANRTLFQTEPPLYPVTLGCVRDALAACRHMERRRDCIDYCEARGIDYERADAYYCAAASIDSALADYEAREKRRRAWQAAVELVASALRALDRCVATLAAVVALGVHILLAAEGAGAGAARPRSTPRNAA